METRIMKGFLLALCLLCFLAPAVFSDVIRIEDGTVYVGKITGADENGVTLEAFGRKIRVASNSILSTETGKTDLQSESLEVHLQNGSVFRGKINDYDPEIGLLMEVDFGSLTIPFENVKTIVDPRQRDRYIGPLGQVGLAAAYHWPVGSLASTFGSGWAASAFAEINLNLVRGLYAGIEATHFFVNYPSSPDVSYGITALVAGPMYRLLVLRTSSIDFINLLVPWASLGGGVAYVSVQDRRAGAYQPSYGELDPAWCAGAGLDVCPLEWLAFRLHARWLAVQQARDLLHMPSVHLGAAYSF
jgi:hypothetical protein